MNRRISCLIVPAAIMIFINCAGPMQTLTFQGDVPLSDAKTSIYFSSDICGLHKFEMAIYPQAELGVSYNYDNRDLIRATFYVYNGGVKNISEGCSTEVVKSYFSRALSDLYAMQSYGKYQNVVIKRQYQDTISINGKDYDALIAECEFSIGDENLKSYALLTGYKGQMFKIRLTGPAALSSAVDEKFKCVLSALGDSSYVKKDQL